MTRFSGSSHTPKQTEGVQAVVPAPLLETPERMKPFTDRQTGHRLHRSITTPQAEL